MDLFAFDRLARSAIDPVFATAQAEDRNYPDYVISAILAAPASRDRCLLQVINRDPTKVADSASLVIRRGSNDEVLVEKNRGGITQLIVALDSADVTKERIEMLVRAFVDNVLRPDG